MSITRRVFMKGGAMAIVGTTAVPAFLTMVTIPLSFSIANGLAFGFTAYSLIKILRGRFREVNWFVYLLTALFIARFIYLANA